MAKNIVKKQTPPLSQQNVLLILKIRDVRVRKMHLPDERANKQLFCADQKGFSSSSCAKQIAAQNYIATRLSTQTQTMKNKKENEEKNSWNAQEVQCTILIKIVVRTHTDNELPRES